MVAEGELRLSGGRYGGGGSKFVVEGCFSGGGSGVWVSGLRFSGGLSHRLEDQRFLAKKLMIPCRTR